MGPHKFVKFARRLMPICPVCLEKLRYSNNLPGELFVHCVTCGWSLVHKMDLKKSRRSFEEMTARIKYEAFDNVIQELMRG